MRIRRLPEGTINRIAAGEVIERPSSIVKELVENSIDAEATRIEVIFRDGGRSFIRVGDNGFGMSSDDLTLAVERHATSKLADDNLIRIKTLGFRGEALPSIGAVARLSILTRARGSSLAHVIEVEGGAASAVRPAALAEGTAVEVCDLFFAVPARLKFLRSERAETAEALDVVRRLAIAHPSIAFRFVTADRQLLDLASLAPDELGLQQRLSGLIGKDFQANSVPFSVSQEGFLVNGYAALPTYHRAQSNMQFVIVNGRPVRDRLLMGAIRAAYADVLPSGRFPVIALFINCDSEQVDVNVHPAKMEVRFRDLALLRALIVRSLKDVLSLAGRSTSSTVSQRAVQLASPYYRHQRAMAFESERPWEVGGFAEDSAPPLAPDLAAAPLGHARGQIHDAYILSETADGIVIVDQHAAHERIVYETMKRQLASSRIATQPLLIPAVIDVDPVSAQRLAAEAELLNRLGLSIEPFGESAVIVREVPAPLSHGSIADLVRDLADNLENAPAGETLEDRMNRLLAGLACHHSVRSGRHLRLEEMNALLRDMEQTLNSGQCNHGRPTHVELKLKDIERLFGRR
ncbi:MAG TPA: DNA mismatch repair endonuclease MutL [Aestuariivirgaceae bacterium]|jgi:DNA mismatch repair protein MutL